MVGGSSFIQLQSMKRIKHTIYKSDGEMFDTPAAIDRETATLFINPKIYFKLTRFQQRFVVLHEEGHLVLNTDIEELADAYAFDRLVGTEYRSMKQMIETLETILDPNRIGHKLRIDALYKRAIEWDKAHPQKLDKGSGSSTPEPTPQDYAEVINAAGKNTTDALQVVQNKEQNSDNNRTMVYMMLAVAALFLLKD